MKVWHLLLLGVLASACEPNAQTISKAVESSLEAGEPGHCVIDGHNLYVIYVQVADDSACVRDNAGASLCSRDWEEFNEQVRRFHHLAPHTTPMVIPETEDESRVTRAGRALKRAGYSDVRVCNGYSDLLEQIDGGYHYPHSTDGGDHVCHFDTTVTERRDEEAGIIERWCRFESGERSGLFATFSIETRQPISVGSYRGDLKHFLWLFFDAAGDVERTQWYWDDVPGSAILGQTGEE